MVNRIKINVTQEMINKGSITMTECPLALALQAEGYSDGWVAFTKAHIQSGLAHQAFKLSGRAIAFRVRFDLGRPVKPATFVLTREREADVDAVEIEAMVAAIKASRKQTEVNGHEAK